MPGRIIRDALLGSPAWQGLPDAETQLLFIRLILIADDFGTYDGRLEVICNNAWPAVVLMEEEIDGAAKMMDALYRAGMIIRYSNAGKPYIAIWQWGCDLRGARKFPAPPIDVDLEGLKPRGKFGKDIGWVNPPGCDAVSILLDFDGRAVVPQPPEWRPPEHFRASPKSKVGWERKTVLPVTGRVIEEAQRQAASNTLPVTSSESQPLDTGSSVAVDGRQYTVASSRTPDAGVESVAIAPPVTPTATGANGEEIIKFEGGAFIGLTEEQRIKWQEMWDDIRIPDQVSRAAEWLIANPAECNLYRQQDNGIRAFLVRWLLRESRAAEKRA